MMWKRKLLSVVFVFFCASAQATLLLQLNVEQMTALSEKVFSGVCESVEEISDEYGRPVLKVTYKVYRMLKGPASEKVTFTQLGALPNPGKELQGVIKDLPTYRKGEEAVVFLSAPGETGLTAPIGLTQGKFVVEESGRRKTVSNGFNNQGLFRLETKKSVLGTASLNTAEKKVLNQRKAGPVAYDDFLSLVEKIVVGQ